MGTLTGSHQQLGRNTAFALITGIALGALAACSSDDESTAANQPGESGSGGTSASNASSSQGGMSAESSTSGDATINGGQSSTQTSTTGGTNTASPSTTSGTSATSNASGGTQAMGGTNASGGSNPQSNSSRTGGTSSTGDATSGTGPVTTPDPVKPQTNLSAAARTDIKHTAAGAGLRLISLNLVPEPESTLNYIELFGEVKNTGTSLVCFPRINFEFVNTSGTVLWNGTGYADTAPYISSSSTLSTSCLKPGESGAIWSNELPASPITVASIAEFTGTLDGLATTVTPFPHTLTTSIVQDTIYVDNNHWAMSGSFKPSQTVRNIGITGYTKSSSGLLTGRLTATNLDSIAANTAWPFATDLGIEGPKPASLLASVEFILGTELTATAGAMSPLTTDPVLDPIAIEQRTARKQAEARKALVDDLRR